MLSIRNGPDPARLDRGRLRLAAGCARDRAVCHFEAVGEIFPRVPLALLHHLDFLLLRHRVMLDEERGGDVIVPRSAPRLRRS